MSNVLNRFNQPASSSRDNKLIVGGSIETAGSQSLKKIYLTTQIEDISTASQTYVVSPVAGTISKIYSVLNGAITTADSILIAKINGTTVTGSNITVSHTGSAAGDVDSSTPTALNTINAGQAIEIETDGGSNTNAKVIITIEITLS